MSLSLSRHTSDAAYPDEYSLSAEEEITEAQQPSTGSGDFYNPYCISPANPTQFSYYTRETTDQNKRSNSLTSMAGATNQSSVGTGETSICFTRGSGPGSQNSRRAGAASSRQSTNSRTGGESSYHNRSSTYSRPPLTKIRLADPTPVTFVDVDSNCNEITNTNRQHDRLCLASNSTTLESIDCQLKLFQTQDELRKLENHVRHVEQKATDKQEQLRIQLETLENEIRGLIETKEHDKELWLKSMGEIEEKANMARDKLNVTMVHNEKLKAENVQIKVEQKKIRSQLEELQLKSIRDKMERKKYREIIRDLQQRESDVKKQLAGLSKLPTEKSQLSHLSSNSSTNVELGPTMRKTKAQTNDCANIDTQFLWTTERVRQLLNRQSNKPATTATTHVVTVSPIGSNTTITAIHSNSKKGLLVRPATATAANNRTTTVTKINLSSYQLKPSTTSEESDEEAILRELFFPFEI